MIQGVYPGVTTSELDELAAQTSAYMATQHPDFSQLAARISVSNLHKQTEKASLPVVLVLDFQPLYFKKNILASRILFQVLYAI